MQKNEIVEHIGIKENKDIDYSGYSIPELAFVLKGVVEEIDNRGEKLSKMQGSLDKKRGALLHDIEFGEMCNKEKINKIDEIKEVSCERRKIKNAIIAHQQLRKALDGKKVLNRVNGLFANTIKKEKNGELIGVMKTNLKQGEVRRLMGKYLDSQ